MAFKTLTLTSACHSLVWHAWTVGEERGVATEAVFLYHFLSGFPYVDSLGLFAECKYCRVTQAVTGLEIVLSHEAVMWHMACIAVSDTPVSAVRPGGKLGSHNVAVNAYPWVVREVRGGIGNLQQEEKQAGKGTEDAYHRSFPLLGRGEEADQFPGFAHHSSLFVFRTLAFTLPPDSGENGFQVKLTKQSATRAVPYLLSIVRDSLMTVGSPR